MARSKIVSGALLPLRLCPPLRHHKEGGTDGKRTHFGRRRRAGPLTTGPHPMAKHNQSTQTITEELLHSLPKTDLHCHLDGSVRLETVLDLAEQQKVRLPAEDADGLRQHGGARRGLREPRRLPQGVRHHPVGDAGGGCARPRRLRTGRGLRHGERALPRGALLADPAHCARACASPRSSRRSSTGSSSGEKQFRREDRRHHLRHAQHQPRDLVPPGRAGDRLQEPRRRRLRPRRRRGGLPGQEAQGRVLPHPEQQHQLHRCTPARATGRSPSTRRCTTAARTASATARG